MSIVWSRVGMVVRMIRLSKEMSQDDFAEAVGLTVGFVSHVETGMRSPSPDSLELMAAVLDIPVSYIVLLAEFDKFTDMTNPLDKLWEMPGDLIKRYMAGELQLTDITKRSLSGVLPKFDESKIPLEEIG